MSPINAISLNLSVYGIFICRFKKKNKKKRKSYIDFFCLYNKKKIQYFSITIGSRYFNYSAGCLIKKSSKILKFFKKTRASINILLNSLKKKFQKKLKKIFFFFCKNLNYKNYLWLKNLFYLIKPSIFFFYTTQGYMYIKKKKRRIKKKILKMLLKNNLKI